jgi:hypothetical protein
MKRFLRRAAGSENDPAARNLIPALTAPGGRRKKPGSVIDKDWAQDRFLLTD